jgi:hypothetical protein
MLNSTHNPIVHRKVTHSAANALIVSGTATIVAFVFHNVQGSMG